MGSGEEDSTGCKGAESLGQTIRTSLLDWSGVALGRLGHQPAKHHLLLIAVSTRMLYDAVKAKAAAAATLPRDGNSARLPEVGGIPIDPALAHAADVGVG